MRNYDFQKWEELYTNDIVLLLTRIHAYREKQDLFEKMNPEPLHKLIELSKIQSTEASNKIEGIYTSDDRLKKIAMNKTMPKNRDEEEIAGYRDVLETVHNNYEYISVKPTIILQLHRDLYKFTGKETAGKYKGSDNVIEEEDGEGNKYVRFKPVSAWETSEAVEKLCSAYEKAITQDEIDPLFIIPVFILDFLCIHPFNDGNGRMSRIITLLLLYKAGYKVGKYVSLERITEKTKEAYYASLKQSSDKWHDEKNDYKPFIKYMLTTVVNAYMELSQNIDVIVDKKLSKPDKVRDVIKNKIGKITKAEIVECCPDVSKTTVERTLSSLQRNNEIKKIGGGRYTSYIWIGKEE